MESAMLKCLYSSPVLTPVLQNVESTSCLAKLLLILIDKNRWWFIFCWFTNWLNGQCFSPIGVVKLPPRSKLDICKEKVILSSVCSNWTSNIHTIKSDVLENTSGLRIWSTIQKCSWVIKTFYLDVSPMEIWYDSLIVQINSTATGNAASRSWARRSDVYYRLEGLILSSKYDQWTVGLFLAPLDFFFNNVLRSQNLTSEYTLIIIITYRKDGRALP